MQRSTGARIQCAYKALMQIFNMNTKCKNYAEKQKEKNPELEKNIYKKIDKRMNLLRQKRKNTTEGKGGQQKLRRARCFVVI